MPNIESILKGDPMSLKSYIVSQSEHGQRVLDTVNPLPAAADFPCQCCGGRGAVATITQFYRLDREVTPVMKRHGGEVRSVSVMKCRTCEGRGVDQVALLNDQRGAA